MHIAILGRQPALGMAELEHLYSESDVRWFSDVSATVASDIFSIRRLGGTQKAGRVVAELPHGDWHRASMKIVQTYAHEWSNFDGKITLGISAYGFDVSPREIQKTGIVLKQKLKKANVSLRLIPNTDPALNTATSHHNKLGLSNNKVELLVVRARSGRIIIAESTGAQNITAYTKRDQERPKRDAFVGMLPPKLAQIMINLASSNSPPSSPPHSHNTALIRHASSADGSLQSAELALLKQSSPGQETPAEETGNEHGVDVAREAEAAAAQTGSTGAEEASSRSVPGFIKHLQPETEPTPGLDVSPGAKPFTETGGRRGEQDRETLLDPFCGTGVVLQEAVLMGYSVYGTDLVDKMVEYSQTNLKWLADSHHVAVAARLHQGDAMDTTWKQPIDAVVCEGYLGQPFSAPPSPAKLDQVRKNCNHIMSTFLKNIAGQIKSGTPLCVALPAWRSISGDFTHLPLINQLEQLGFTEYEFKNIKRSELLYYREDQVVARELLVLVKS